MEAVEPLADRAPVVVELDGELDAADDAWAAELAAVLDAGTDRIVVDMRGVSFIDSSVVQALVLAHRRVSPHGWVRIVYTHHLIARVIDICGLTDLFPHYTSVESARRETPSRVTTTPEARPER